MGYVNSSGAYVSTSTTSNPYQTANPAPATGGGSSGGGSSGGSTGQSYTYTGAGGQTYTATPNANITAAQAAAVANNPLYTPVKAPTTTQQVTQATPGLVLNTPTTIGSINTANGANAGLATTIAGQQAQMQQETDANTAARLATIKANSDNNNSTLNSLLGTQPNRNQETTNQENALGINRQAYFLKVQAEQADIASLSSAYQTAKDNLDQQIQQAHGYGATDFANNAEAQMRRNAAPELNALAAQVNFKTALLQNEQGNFKDAEALVNQAVNNIVSDYQDRVNAYNMIKANNTETFNAMDKVYQDAFNSHIQMEQDNLNQLRTDTKTVLTMAMDNPQAAIQPTDSLTVAMQKLQNNPKTTGTIEKDANGNTVNIIRDSQGNVVKTTPVAGLGGGNGLSTVEVQNGATNAGMNAADFKGLPVDVQTFFTKSTDTQIAPLKQALSDVSTGAMTIEDYNKQIDSAGLAPAVSSQFKSWGTTAAQSAPPKTKGFLSKAWDFIMGQ